MGEGLRWAKQGSAESMQSCIIKPLALVARSHRSPLRNQKDCPSSLPAQDKEEKNICLPAPVPSQARVCPGYQLVALPVLWTHECGWAFSLKCPTKRYREARNSQRQSALGCTWMHICLLQQHVERRSGLKECEVGPAMSNPPPSRLLLGHHCENYTMAIPKLQRMAGSRGKRELQT